MNKKQLKAQAACYKAAYDKTLQSYAAWKRNAVLEDIAAKHNSSFVDEFVKAVIVCAEASENVVAASATPSIEQKSAVKAKVPNMDKKF